ncbi:hypothetical protein ACFE04_018414 [Oxalis oulophora]
MSGAGVQITRGRGGDDDRLLLKPRGSGGAGAGGSGGAGGVHHQTKKQSASASAADVDREPVNNKMNRTKPNSSVGPSNLKRFIEAITPHVPSQYLSKTTTRSLRTSDDVEELQLPYFMLADLWESLREWSVYGAGVPLILNDSNCRVVQYYVPYLSAIQLYGDKPIIKSTVNSRIMVSPHCALLTPNLSKLHGLWMNSCVRLSLRQPGEDTDSDFRDSSSDGCSDSEADRGLQYSTEQRIVTGNIPPRIGRLSLRDNHSVLHADCSSDEGESMISHRNILFEYFEYASPFGREPLADKISDLARRFPVLKALRSCDLSPSSWISVAWYPIYKIPTGRTFKDLETCFLTYHALHTPVGGAQGVQPPATSLVTPGDIDGVCKLPLPVFGLASFKFNSHLWTPNTGGDQHLVNSLLQAADSWLRKLDVSHPDFNFFSRW